MKKTYLQNLLILLLLFLAVWIGVSSLSEPNKSNNLDLTEEKITEHLKQIAQKPHPVGSHESQNVREYIISYLKNLGLEPEIQNTVSFKTYKNEVIASRVYNIIVKISGKNPSGTIALMGHYDSMPMTSGANDNASAVITLLEAAKLFVSDETLNNNVVLLFTDNEEYYQLGAKAFLEQHPLAKEISVVLNFEGIGKNGPSIMFEPGPNSGWLVKHFAQSSPMPVAQSWFYDIYKNTPLNTDFSVFRKHEIPGLNFVYLFNGTIYHTMLDNIDNINHQGVQHHLINALSVVKNIDGIDFSQNYSQSDDQIYFTLFRGVLISFSTSLAIPLAIFMGILLLSIMIIGVRRKQISIIRTISSIGIFLLIISLIGAIIFGATQLIFALYENYQVMFFERLYNAQYYFWCFFFLTLFLSLIYYSYFSKKLGQNNIIMGILITWWIFAISTSILIPGMSYLFLFPLLFSSLSFGWVILKNIKNETSFQRNIIQTIGILPAVLIYTPTVIVMFNFAPNSLFAVTLFFVALLFGLLIPQYLNQIKIKKYILPLVAISLSLLFFIIAHFTSGFSEEKPQPNGIAYLHNLDTKEALWFSPGSKTDVWTSQFYKDEPEIKYLQDILPLSMDYYRTIITGKAESIKLPEPQIEIIKDTLFQQNGFVKLLIKSNRNAPIMTVSLKHISEIQSVKVDNLLVENYKCTKGQSLDLIYLGVAEDGFILELETDQKGEFEVEITDQSRSLPSELEHKFKPRSNDMIPMPNFDYSTILVKSTKF